MSGWPQDGEARPKEADVLASPARRHTRRLEDKLLIAFHHACDVGDYEVARHVLGILEVMLSRNTTQADNHRRRNLDNLVAAYERLWQLRNRGA